MNFILPYRRAHPSPRGRPRVLARSFAVLGVSSIIAGCAVDQAKEVRAYRSVIDLPARAEEYTPGSPLSLEDAIRLANAQNERLSDEGETYLQALIDRQRTASSMLPTLDLFAGYVFRENTGAEAVGPGGESSSSQARTTTFDAGVGAQYTIFSGATNLNRVRAAEATIEQRRWLLLDLREALLLEVAQAYYGVLRAERLVGVIESSVAVQEERLRDIRGRQSVGFARPLDVSQIEAQASETRVLLIERNLVAISRSALAFLTGADMHQTELTDDFDLPTDVPEEEGMLTLAALERQDLAAAEAAARSARTSVDAEIGRYYPTVTLNLDYFLSRDAVPTDRDWTGLLSLSLPLFSAGRIEADVRTAWSQFRQTVLQYSQIRRQILRDIETAHRNLSDNVERLGELGTQVNVAQEALRQAEASYQAGLGTNLERVAAQDRLLSAQVQFASAEFTRKVAYLSLLRAAGVLARGITGVDIPPPTPPDNPPDSPFLNLPLPPAAAAAEAN